MADPKYAGLPGIAYDQPDVYESEDLPEADQDTRNMISEDNSDAVEKLDIGVSESYKKFQGRWLDGSRADFSGRLSKTRQTGYNAWHGPYELQAKGEKETTIEKFNRLKCELAELQDEIIQESELKKEEKASSAALAAHVEILQKQLLALQLDGSTGVNLTPNEKSSKKELFAKVEQLLQTAMSTPSAVAGEAGPLLYELRCRPQQSRLEATLKAADLQKRLDKLESLLGANQEKMSRLCAQTGEKCLTDTVSSLQSKVALLEPSHVDQIEGRLSALLQKLNAVSEKRAAIEDADRQSKISELYEMTKKLEPMKTTLPLLVERLVATQALHEEAKNFASAVNHLESSQTHLGDSLAAHAQLLKEVKENLAANMAVVKAAIDGLETRLVSLKK